MTNTEIAQALEVLFPEGNWGTLYGDANNANEYETALKFTGKGKAPTWEQIQSVKLPTLTDKEAEKAVVLAKIGLTGDEAKLLLS